MAATDADGQDTRNDRLRYFAYGSKLSSARLVARVASARKLANATLGGHRRDPLHRRSRPGPRPRGARGY